MKRDCIVLVLMALITINCDLWLPLSQGVSAAVDSCKLHHVPLIKGEVPIIYGDFINTDGLAVKEACGDLFPNARTYIYGGEGEANDSPYNGEVLYCAKCRKALSAWQAERKRRREKTSVLPLCWVR